MEQRSLLRACFTPAVLIGALLVTALLMGITFLFVVLTRQRSVPSQPGTAVVKIISAPTPTSLPPTVSVITSPTPPPSDDTILVGSSVIVNGTGGDGLRLRESPGLQSKILALAPEGELLHVVDGPQQVDNYIWWLLENPQDNKQRGWGVANFLNLSLSP